MRRLVAISVAILLSTTLACGSSSTPTPPTTPGVPTPTPTPGPGINPLCVPTAAFKAGSMTATVDGTAFTAQCVSGSFATGSGYQFTGVESGSATTARTVSFVIRTTGGPATFGAGTDVVTGSVAIGNALWGWAWSPTVPGSNTGTGTIVATTLSPTAGGAGTFSFTATANPGSTASGTKTVTNGTFNVIF